MKSKIDEDSTCDVTWFVHPYGSFIHLHGGSPPGEIHLRRLHCLGAGCTCTEARTYSSAPSWSPSTSAVGSKGLVSCHSTFTSAGSSADPWQVDPGPGFPAGSRLPVRFRLVPAASSCGYHRIVMVENGYERLWSSTKHSLYTRYTLVIPGCSDGYSWLFMVITNCDACCHMVIRTAYNGCPAIKNGCND